MDNNQTPKNKNFRRRRRYGKKTKQKNIENQIQTPSAEETVFPAPEQTLEPAPLPMPEPIAEEIPDQEVASEETKLEVVGIRFRPAGKIYSFDPCGMTFQMGEAVIVETSQGKEFGIVSTPNRMTQEKDAHLPLKKVLRKADETDLEKNEENKKLEQSARKIFHEKVAEHGLDMALSDVECSFDRSKLIFYFTSEGRVDFREFVKDMASVFKTRIELRQIGVRDEAKQLGGLGICGRPLCCSSFLDDFQQVSIKMAKEQNLSLNPTKISGTCGRLMCCLRYENDVYTEAAKKCPRADSLVSTPQGNGVVVESNILSGKCKVKLDSDPENIVPFLAEDLKVIPKQKKNPTPDSEKTKNKFQSCKINKIRQNY